MSKHSESTENALSNVRDSPEESEIDARDDTSDTLHLPDYMWLGTPPTSQHSLFDFDNVFPLPGHEVFYVDSTGSSVTCRPSLSRNTTAPAGYIVPSTFTPQQNNIFTVASVSQASFHNSTTVRLIPASGIGQNRVTTTNQIVAVLHKPGDAVRFHWILPDPTSNSHCRFTCLVLVQAAWVSHWERMYQVHVASQNVSMIAQEGMLSQDP